MFVLLWVRMRAVRGGGGVVVFLLMEVELAFWRVSARMLGIVIKKMEMENCMIIIDGSQKAETVRRGK